MLAIIPQNPVVRLLLIVAALAIFGAVPLFGIPGLLLGKLVRPILDCFLGTGTYDAVMTENGADAFGTFLYVSMNWPLALIPAYFLTRKINHTGGPWALKSYAVFGITTLVGAVAIATVAIYLMMDFKNGGKADETKPGYIEESNN